MYHAPVSGQFLPKHIWTWFAWKRGIKRKHLISHFFTYFRVYNNPLLVVYSYLVDIWPSLSILDKFSNLISSETKRRMKTFCSIPSTYFLSLYSVNSPCTQLYYQLPLDHRVSFQITVLKLYQFPCKALEVATIVYYVTSDNVYAAREHMYTTLLPGSSASSF